MILVVDASVVVKWFFRDPAIGEHAEHALFVLQPEHEIRGKACKNAAMQMLGG